MNVKEPFRESSRPEAVWRREGLPDAGRLARLGIHTRESLDWLAARDPQPPVQAMHIDDPALRDAAHDDAVREHRARINELREGFKSGAFKIREAFATAERFRERERER